MRNVLTCSEVDKLRQFVHSEHPRKEDRLKEQAGQKLDKSAVVVEQLKVMKSTLHYEHQTTDKGTNSDDQYLEFFSHVFSEEWEAVCNDLNHVVKVSKHGINSKAYTHCEEKDSPEVGSWQQSKQGWESHEQQRWT